MKITVNLFANLRDYAPAGQRPAEVSLPGGATAADLLSALRIPPAVQAVLLVNGRRAEAAALLADGDEVTLFPPMEGG
ncbi:MAG: MoaD/ThiS family protein [Desulfobacterales bacterium]|jgi:molybdopterin converting factor small subunit|nr:MoaD/ThiS family protein [Desulfobacterales bacterium]